MDSNKTRLRRILNIHNERGSGEVFRPASAVWKEEKKVFSYIVSKVKQEFMVGLIGFYRMVESKSF